MPSIVLVCVLAAGAATGAALPSVGHLRVPPNGLESSVDQPYRLTVCLRFSDDPIFTRFFTGSVRRQVRDQLANYFGQLVELEVAGEHALLDEAAGGGLAELGVSPEEFYEKGLCDKLFLATVDFEAGLYRIRWRQLDGDVQRIGPLRTRTTPDRQWLSKAICLAVKDDFAPVALVEPKAAQTHVDLEFRGAGRGPRLAALLADGCVLQPFWVIRRQSGMLARVPIPYTVLRIEPGGKIGRAAVVSSLPDPWKRTARVAGFQAIKIGTCSGRFRLRLVDAESGLPVQSCQVYANGTGFDEMRDEHRLEPPDRHGCVVAARPFAHLAYIKIAQSGGSVSRILLPITDAWCEQVCKLRVEEQAAQRGDFERQVTTLVQDVQVLEGMLDQYVRRLNQLNGKKQYEEALKQVRDGVGSVGPLLETARRDMADLSARAVELDVASDRRLAWTTEQVARIGDRVNDLHDMDGKLEQTIEETVACNLAAVQARLAEDLVKQGDVDQAIANYREAVRLCPRAGFQQRLNQLNQTWEIKDDDHRKARTFVFQVWPEVAITRLRERQSEAEEAFRKLVEVDDHLTARRLLKATGEHLRELADLVDMLSGRNAEADRQECEKYIELTDKMARFQLDVGAYLKDRLATPPSPASEAPTGQEPPAVDKSREAEPKALEEDQEEEPLENP